jgi:hypothetical protein
MYVPYSAIQMAQEVGLKIETLLDAGVALRKFLEPVFENEMRKKWNSTKWNWE